MLGHVAATHFLHRRATGVPWPLRLLTILIFLARHAGAVLVVSALLRPGGDLLIALLPFLAAIVAANATGAFNLGLASTAVQDARRIVLRPPQVREWMLGGWTYDPFLSRSVQGDLSLAHLLLAIAANTGRADYLTNADHALDLVENEVLPLFKDDHPLHEQIARARDSYAAIAAPHL